MTSPEGVRRSIDEFDMKMVSDLHEYELYREDKIRDMHVEYARNTRDKILEGHDYDWVVRHLLEEVPRDSKDIALVVEFLNYFLNESGLSVVFDNDCNVFVDGQEVLRSDLGEYFAYAKAHYAESMKQTCQYVATLAAKLILGGQHLEMVRSFLVGDIVTSNLDNVLVAQYLNERLAENGSSLRFDQYMNRIEA